MRYRIAAWPAMCSGPGFGHLWSGAREDGWPMIQHLLSPFLAGNSGSARNPGVGGSAPGAAPLSSPPRSRHRRPRSPCGAGGLKQLCRLPCGEGGGGGGLGRAGCAMLRQAGCAPGLEVRRGKGPAAEEGTAAWPGARDHGHAAAAEPPGVCGCARPPACCREELLRAGWACRCRRKRQERCCPASV